MPVQDTLADEIATPLVEAASLVGASLKTGGTTHEAAPVLEVALPISLSDAARELPATNEESVDGVGMSRDAVYRRTLAAVDTLAATGALLFSMLVVGLDQPDVVYVLFLAPLIVVMGKALGLYDREEWVVRKSTLDEAPGLFQVATLYAIAIWLVNGFVITHTSDRRVLLVIWPVLFLNLLVLRSLGRWGCRHVTPAERCLVIGDERTCDRMRTKLNRTGSLHATVVAQIRLLSSGAEDNAMLTLADHDDLKAIASAYRVDRIMLAPERADAEEVLNLIRAATSLGIKISVVPRMLEVVGSSAVFDDLEGMPLLSMRRARLTRSSYLIKRGVDVAGSAIALVLLAPLFAMIALVTKLDSEGTVFYRQLRIGLDGKGFEMLKFRTMLPDSHARRAELLDLNQASGLFKIDKDPRITRAGTWLRRLSLDELPQLWNVFRGDMSLVGPRPLIAEEDRQIQGWHRRRLQLTPGMTGHWQILGSARIPLDEMVKIDYLYVTNWSLWLDIKILLKTVAYVAARKGM